MSMLLLVHVIGTRHENAYVLIVLLICIKMLHYIYKFHPESEYCRNKIVSYYLKINTVYEKIQ